ncbi:MULTISPECIES: cyclophane-forming radical SAM peptide maturase AmcB [Actinoalloteichus]|uniref:Arylsulfatase regulator (Fe-S oxidoreductase) n=1 Tax=Actinoalloteichus fjordicus TaxID=1612552 RepID=A0AAC9PUL6_9PSEU|nr:MULTISPECIES: cyclophane-forming radical SAM peptide maturase AmcB [Actinoalloteichus]APU17333.1 arylsulfatase regulator (Fe-S oxidoreductase) [Actinoalloteichus fjordicus]APU23417.1 arylsulfatase regulator (Fe-S oxidoreductase) [Actinoalloteichus sp. GBA129-24]
MKDTLQESAVQNPDTGSRFFTSPGSVVLQPETLCNLDCSYCYLPFRKSRNTMSLAVAQAVAESIRSWTAQTKVDVCWHGGEPLAAGREKLGQLMDCFSGLDVQHEIQTNATLVNDAWCEFFTERRVRVGVSIDGHSVDDANRIDRRGLPAHDRIAKGIQILREHGHTISGIAVVSNPTPQRAQRLIRFAEENGISTLGVNIEEQEGVNIKVNENDHHTTISFWSELARNWLAHSTIDIREIRRALGYLDSVLRNDAHASHRPPLVDPLPTVAYDGSVTLISPELAGFNSTTGSFATGNVLQQSLDEIIAAAGEASWIQEFKSGIGACAETCPYFDFCGGGHASNRYFEHGRMDGTETNYCRNSKIALMEGILNVAEHRIADDPNS